MRAPILIGYWTVGVGALVLVGGIWFAIQACIRTWTWQPAPAQVLTSSIDSRVDSENTRMFYGVYRLRYEANGGVREATLRSPSSSSSEPEIRKRVSARPPGAAVMIYYNPSDPDKVVLEAGLNIATFAVPIGFACMGLLSGIVGGIVLFASQGADW